MSQFEDKLGKYVSDLLALEKHLLEAVQQQKSTDTVENYAEVKALLNKVEHELLHHTDHLEKHRQTLGGETISIKETLSAVAGTLAGLFGQIRDEPASKMLRDDYTALGMAAISYTMVNTAALAVDDEKTANIAFKHLTDLTPLIVEISELMPSVVAREMIADEDTREQIALKSLTTTQQAWQPEAVSQ